MWDLSQLTMSSRFRVEALSLCRQSWAGYSRNLMPTWMMKALKQGTEKMFILEALNWRNQAGIRVLTLSTVESHSENPRSDRALA